MKATPRKQKRPKTVAIQPTPPPLESVPLERPVAIHFAAWRRHALLLLGLFAVALLAWSNSFNSGFVFDNKVLILDPRIKAATPQNIDLILHQEFWYGWTQSGLYRPLATFSYLFNYAILGNGAHPAGYHWINFALHIINIALVYALGLLVLEEIAPAFAMAALWALHPILTESVTNIIGRADLLAAFGVLAGLLCHVRAASARGWRKAAWLAALALAVTIGIFSKESTVVVPGVMLIYDLTFTGASWRARAPGYVALALPLAGFFFVRAQVLAKLPPVHYAFGDNPLSSADFWTARFTAVKVIGKCVWRLLWPRQLSADYSYNQIPLVTWQFQSWEDWKALLSLAVCVGLGLVAILCYRRSKPAFFFIAFFFVTLAPTSNIFLIIGTIMAERFLYLPSVAFAGCLVLAIFSVCRSLPAAGPAFRFVAPSLLGAIAIAFAARTYSRNFDWHDEKALFASEAQVSPASFKAHMSLASALNDGTPAGLDRGILEAERAVAILQGLPDRSLVDSAYVNLGSYYRQKGDLLADRKPDRSFVSNPRSQPWYQKSQAALLEAERLERVQSDANRRRDIASGKDKTFEYGMYQLDRELGRTYWRLGDYGHALAAFARGRARHTEPEFYLEMAGVLRAAGSPRQAAVTLLEGIIQDPSYTKLASGVVEIYQQIDPQGCAVQGAGPSVNLNLGCPLVHDDICSASRNVAERYRKRNQDEAADRTVRTAVTQLGCPVKVFQ